MEKSAEIRFSLVLLISFFLHVVVFIGIILPNFHDLPKLEKGRGALLFRGRDIIVNINQNDERNIRDKTLLSDRDSTARGYITKEKGDRWLNNSLDFHLKRGRTSVGQSMTYTKPIKVSNVILNEKSEIALFIRKYIPPKDIYGNEGTSYNIRIPDKNDITMKNAIFYSNTGEFSYNTAKFKNFKYFKAMKEKIASNWFLPGMTNVAFGGYNPVTRTFSTARGYERYLSIPSQRVKIFFTMNRRGDVLKVYLI